MLDFLHGCVDLLVAFLPSNFLAVWFIPMICLSLVASVPAFIRVLTTWR